MSKRRKPTPDTQLSIFDYLDRQAKQSEADTPHPLLVSQQWQFSLAYVDVDGNPDHYLYHAVQWTQGLGAKGHTVWQNIKKQTVISNDKLKTLPYTASDGKTYQVDFIDQQTCYDVAQAMRLTRKNPQLKEIRDYLSLSGVFVDKSRRDTEGAIRFHQSRLKGVEIRNRFTEVARESHIYRSPNYGRLTNATYKALRLANREETATKEIIKQLQLTPTQASHLRDHLTTLANDAIAMAENASAMVMDGKSLDDEAQMEIVREMAALVAPSLWALAKRANIDPITGQKLLKSHYDYE